VDANGDKIREAIERESSMKTRTWVPIALLLLPSALAADTVYLKGGGKVSGRIVTRTDSQVEVDVGAGTMKVSLANVDRIVEGSSALGEYAKRAAAVRPDDAEGWRELGRWARSQGLNTQAAQAYEKVLTVAPSDAEANEALGRVQVGGRWVSEEESYRARGYVKFEGEWMMPAEQQAIQRDRSAALETERARKESERAREAAERAREQEPAQEEQEGIPLYWGWGTGPAAWPGTNFPRGPTTLPARNPR
jgi:tetratricopeptide (TPR) repeat protein